MRQVEKGQIAANNPGPIQSALVGEIGSRTRIGHFCLLAGNLTLAGIGEATPTDDPPELDPDQSWSAALAEIGELDRVRQEIASLPLALTGSRIAPPKRAMFIGDVARHQRRQIMSAMRGQGLVTVDQLSVLATRFVDGDPNLLANRIQTHRPDLVVIAFTGPQSPAALRIASRIIRHLVLPEPGIPKPLVALLGGPSATDSARDELGPAVASIILPQDAGVDSGIQSLHAELAAGYDVLLKRLHIDLVPPGLTKVPVIPLSAALRRVAWRLADSMGIRVAVAHAEPFGVTVALAGSGSARIAAFGYLPDDPNGGHFGLKLNIDQIRRWLPSPISDGQIWASLLTRAGRPWGLPATRIDRQVEDAATMAGIANAAEQLQLPEVECDLAVATGSLLGSDSAPVPAAGKLLNGLLPVRFCQLAQDESSTLAMLGALDLLGMTVDPADALTPLGLAAAPAGSGRDGEAALRLLVDRGDGRRLDRIVPFGGTVRLAVGLDEPVSVAAAPASGLDLGRGPGRSVRLKTKIAPGLGGIIVDTRGRPLEFADDIDAQSGHALQWLQGLDAYHGSGRSGSE